MQPVLTVAMVPVNTSTSNLASTLTVQAPVQPKAQAPIQSTQIQKASQQTFNAQEQPVAISVPTYTLMPPQQPIVLQSYIVPTVMTDNTQATQVAINNQQLSSNGVEVPILLSNFLTDKSNPINDIVDNKMGIPQPAQTVQQGPSVNKNAGNNEVAGGVDINKMALLPTGYGDYLNMVMKDSAFYEPKEVYKNQKTVDNVKALRQLSSDRLHQQMVEQQYAR
jgi:hypothetical protein